VKQPFRPTSTLSVGATPEGGEASPKAEVPGTTQPANRFVFSCVSVTEQLFFAGSGDHVFVTKFQAIDGPDFVDAPNGLLELWTTAKVFVPGRRYYLYVSPAD
jgi:hypothetical protein